MAKAEDFAKRFNAIPQNASLGYISDQNWSFDSSMSYFNQILFKFISIRWAVILNLRFTRIT